MRGDRKPLSSLSKLALQSPAVTNYRDLFGFRLTPKMRRFFRSELTPARGFLENVQRLTSQSNSGKRVQFNQLQCDFLVRGLDVAIRIIESGTLRRLPRSQTEVVLFKIGVEIQRFVEGCCDEKWIKSALILANMSTEVFRLLSNLEFLLVCVNFDEAEEAPNWGQLDVFSTLESSKQGVVCDRRTLLARLETLNTSPHNNSDSSTSATESELAICLLGRLRKQLSGSADMDVWKIDCLNLRRVQRLGSGSFGTVHRSIWLPGQITVAEKMIYGSDHPSFRNEVEVLARLAHPNIVPFLGYAVGDGKCSIIMELMDGDLSSLMEDRLRGDRALKPPFSLFEAVDLMLQTAEGVRYLHEHKIVHRDLKSQNILVRRWEVEGEEYVYLKLADFGLAKTKENSITSSNQTPNLGTPRWMAPELIIVPDPQPGTYTSFVYSWLSNWEKQLKHPFKVDIYSFGMVCYEILTGKVPFWDTASPREVKKMVLKGDRPTLPAELPGHLKMLIESCWDSDVRRRPSMKEVCLRLRDVKFLLMRYGIYK